MGGGGGGWRSLLFDEGDAFVYSLVANESADGHWFRYLIRDEHASFHPPLTVVALLPRRRRSTAACSPSGSR